MTAGLGAPWHIRKFSLLTVGVMANALVVPTLVLWLLSQASTAPAVIRLGPTGDRLSADDLAQIARLAKDKAGSPWVVVGYPPAPLRDSAQWFVTVFIGPDSWKSALNIGTTLTLVTTLSAPAVYEGQKVWRVEAVGQYAQLPVSGSDQRLVLSGRDLNRPFRVVGAVDEGALRTIVSIIRGSPTVPAPSTTGQPPAPIFTTVQGQWPIANVVFRDASLVEVGLLDENPLEKSGQKVMMRKVGATWSIERLFFWIAD